MNFHLEARVRKGIKARFEIFNILDKPRKRKRTVFDGSRSLSDIAFIEDRSRIDGQWFRLTISGLF